MRQKITMLNVRQIKILSAVLTHDGMSVEDVATELDTSNRTVISDMETINDALKEYQIVIENKRGKGYVFRGGDTRMLEYVRRQCFAFSYFYHFNKYKDKTRVYFIVRRLLAEEDAIKVEDLAGQMNYSKAALNADLKEVRELFRRYELELETRPYYGLRVTGSGCAMLQAMVDFCDIHDCAGDGMVPLFQQSLYQYGIPWERWQELARIMGDTLIRNTYRLSDGALNRLTAYLAVYEKKPHRVLEAPHILRPLMCRTKEYRIMETVFGKARFPAEESVVAFFSLILLGNRDFAHPGDDSAYGILYEQACELNYYIQGFLTRELHLDLDANPDFGKHLSGLLMSYTARMYLRVHEYEYYGEAYNVAKGFPAARMLACRILYELYRKTGYPYDESLAVTWSVFLYNALMMIPSIHRKLRIVLTSSLGLMGNESLKYKLMSHYHHYIDRIDFCEIYELDKVDFKNYDYILTSYPEQMMKDYPVPVLFFQYFLGEKDLYQFRDRIILTAVSEDTLFCGMGKEHFHRDCPVQDRREFLKLLAGQIRLKEWDERQLEEYLVYADQVYPFVQNQSVMVLPLFTRFAQEQVTELYAFAQPFLWNDRHVTHALVTVIYLNYRPQIVKQMDSLLRRIIRGSIRVEDILEKYVRD